ncbi:MAG: Gfo/Idh/MocA family oxidoreductase [Gammaproteobacteria bacterium]|jgi:predicted dehydrogenase|nr:Gfo/Idh/MocA family oxidoreductase [Gammaproteobacteria bacterium]
MPTLRTAVIGVGYLGRFHAEKFAMLPQSELVAVADSREESAAEVANRLGVDAVTDYRDLLGRVDAVSIVVPTRSHFSIARDFLGHGTHVLIEKPMTSTVEEAGDLIDLAREKGRVLQVGHLERFNNAILDLDRVLDRPMFIESHRVAPFKPRGTDVSVILDLMIHDIDIILNMVGADLDRIDASGVPVLSDEVDIANARLVFENGCVANVTASRISMKSERKMRIFQHDAYISVDFQERVLSIHRKGDGEMFPGIPDIESEQTRHEDGDALRTEIDHFLHAAIEGREPLVTGEDGKRALEAAMRITELLSSQKPVSPANSGSD